MLLFFACGDPLLGDELDCEEAVSHLQGCCPGFDSNSISCVHKDGCNASLPDITQSQSACIRATSCEQLAAAGVCGLPSTQASPPGLASVIQVCP